MRQVRNSLCRYIVMLKKKNRNKEKGMSLIEILPIFIVITTLFSFLLGAWGISHKHILTSIAARTYAFETLNNRSTFIYFNDTRSGVRAYKGSYEATESRYHGIGRNQPGNFSAPVVPIRYIANKNTVRRTGPDSLHIQGMWDTGYERGQEITPGNLQDLDHIWVTVGHGICINARCGGN